MIYLIWIQIITYICLVTAQTFNPNPLFLLVVYDGFRWDYIDTIRSHNYNTTPTFNYLIEHGVKASHVLNVYPTSTIPNHMTLLTGLYPENHGLVNNDFYDPHLNLTYNLFSEPQDDNINSKFFDYGSEPIWVTNFMASEDRFSGSTLFPGTLAPVKGINITHAIPGRLFNTNITYHERVDKLIGWFTHPEKPINLGLLYYDEPDENCHLYGPESTNVYNSVVELDRFTGYLIEQLRVHGLLDRMNIVFTGDHGGTYLSEHRLVNLSNYVDDSLYMMHIPSLYSTMVPVKGMEEPLFRELKSVQMKHPQIQVFRKKDDDPSFTPLHFRSSDRIPPIVIIPDLGWRVIHGNYTFELRACGLIQDIYIYIYIGPSMKNAGGHGYNTSHSDMWPYFIAYGPAFRSGFKTGEIHMVDIYELMCHLLEINPAPNNGSLERIRIILKPNIRNFAIIIISTPVVCLAVILCLAILLKFLEHKRKCDCHNRTPNHLSYDEDASQLLENESNM